MTPEARKFYAENYRACKWCKEDSWKGFQRLGLCPLCMSNAEAFGMILIGALLLLATFWREK